MADERVNNDDNILDENVRSEEEEELLSSDNYTDDFDGDDFSDPEEYEKYVPVSVVEEEEQEDAEDDEKEEKELKRKKRAKSKKKAKETAARIVKPIIAILSVLLGAFLVLYICCIVTLPKDTVANNVMIENLDVSGLSYDDALAAIEATYLFETQNITIECDGNTRVLDGRKIGLTATPAATAQKAFNYGKTGNVFRDGFTAMGLIFHKKNIVPVPDMNFDVINAELGAFGTELRGTLKQVAVEITDAGAVITPGTSGFDHNTDIAREQIIAAVNNEQFDNIHVTLNAVAPDAPTVEYIGNAIYLDPIDAYYHVDGNEIMVIAEVAGRYYNSEELEAALGQIYEGGPQVTVPYYPSYASVTAEQLKAKLFSKTLGSYATTFAAGGNRGKNVARAASLINGTIIASGQEFSFNKTVGPRSFANGFFTAPEYVNGQSVEGIGGGVCQVSTTLYSAVLYADMGITSRTEHMMSVGYAPLGQDATVVYGSIDFKFKNTSDYPVKIVANTNGGRLAVSIVGTDWVPARQVKITHSQSTKGANTVVTSKRLVYSNGELISTDQLDTSVYAPHQVETPDEPVSEAESASSSEETAQESTPASASTESRSPNTSADTSANEAASGSAAASSAAASNGGAVSSAID